MFNNYKNVEESQVGRLVMSKLGLAHVKHFVGRDLANGPRSIQGEGLLGPQAIKKFHPE